eukprot:m.119646 g.119646  ORF g.119646 m.119646 type:complete len:1021 (+) comp11028_c1_seq2:326-3388(+)
MNNGPESDSDYSALLTSPDESEDDQEDEFTEDTDEDLSEQDDDDEETDGDNDSGGPERELWDACGENNVDEVRRLIGSGIDVNRIDPARGSAPIHVAAELGCLDVIQVLVEEGGADRWLRDDEGSTALHAAAMNAEFAVAQFLIDSGASVDAVDQDEDTPLHVSVASSVSDQAGITICTALIAAGADIDARNESGWTPLHVAVENLQVWAVRLLINSGCNVNAVDRDGETPLHLVAGSEFDEGNAIAVLHLLLGAHPNIDLPKPDGHTALHIATLAQKAPLVRLLLQAGADPDLHTPPLNVSARELAVSHGHDDMLAIFEERLAWKSRQLPARQPSVLEADWPELPALAVRGPLLELTVDGDGSRTCYVHQAPSIDSPVVGSVKHGSHVHSYRSSMHRASDGSVWLKVAHWPLDGATHGDAPPPPSTDTGAGTSSSHNDGDGDGAMATQESSTTTTSSTSSSSAWICAADPQRRFPGLSWLMDGVSMLLGFKVMAPAAVLFSAPLCDHTTAQVLHGIRRFFRLGADKVILADVVGDVPDTCHGDASAADPNAIPGGLGNMLIAIARRSLSGLAGAPNGSEPPNCVLALEATELTVDSLPLLIREALNTYVIVTRCDHPDSLETLASVAMNMGDRLLLAISEHAGSNLTKLQMNRMGWEKKRRKGDAPASFNSVNGGAACGAGGASDGTTTLLEGGTAFDSVDDVSGGAATDRTATPTAAAVPAVSPLGAADASEVESATTTTVAAPAGADVDVNINTDSRHDEETDARRHGSSVTPTPSAPSTGMATAEETAAAAAADALSSSVFVGTSRAEVNLAIARQRLEEVMKGGGTSQAKRWDSDGRVPGIDPLWLDHDGGEFGAAAAAPAADAPGAGTNTVASGMGGHSTAVRQNRNQNGSTLSSSSRHGANTGNDHGHDVSNHPSPMVEEPAAGNTPSPLVEEPDSPPRDDNDTLGGGQRLPEVDYLCRLTDLDETQAAMWLDMAGGSVERSLELFLEVGGAANSRGQREREEQLAYSRASSL